MPTKPKDKFPEVPDTANERYFDRSIRHQVGVRRMTAGTVLALAALMEGNDRQLSLAIRATLHNAHKPLDAGARELYSLVRTMRDGHFTDLKFRVQDIMGETSTIEQDAELALLLATLGFPYKFRKPTQGVRNDMVRQPFAIGLDSKRTLDQWFAAIALGDSDRINGAVMLGLSQNESNNQILARVVGTRENKFGDGAAAKTRLQMEILTRTAINHTVNATRESVWLANEDGILALKWTSILDTRTSAICRSRDGDYAPVGGKPLPSGLPRLIPPEARPPAHPNCRSIMTAILNSDGIALGLPSILKTKTPINFTQQAKRRAGNDAWKKMDKAARTKAIKKQKQIFTTGTVGGIPNEVTYGEWLARQPAKVQDEILGKGKGKLFRSGKVTVDSFVDRAGNELTLKELRKL